MYALTTRGFLLWTTYGIGRGQWPLILTKAICFLLAAFILMMTPLSPRKKEAVAESLDPKD